MAWGDFQEGKWTKGKSPSWELQEPFKSRYPEPLFSIERQSAYESYLKFWYKKSEQLKSSKLKWKGLPTLNPIILTNWPSLVFQGNDTFMCDPNGNLFLWFSTCGTNVSRVCAVYLFWGVCVTVPAGRTYGNMCASATDVQITLALRSEQNDFWVSK